MKTFLLYILAFLPLSVYATESNDTISSDSCASRSLVSRLDSVLDSPVLDISSVGVMVYDLTADSTVYCHGHRKTLRPASTMKLITAIAAIDRLGGSHQFRTSLNYTG